MFAYQNAWDILPEILSRYHKRLELEWHRRAPECPPVLYHYTTPSGFAAILRSKVLWATATTHLNDKDELRYAGALVRDALGRAALEKNDEERKVLFPPDFVGIEYGLGGAVETFVASLSAAQDDLAQWSVYGASGYGLAIGFDSRQLRQASDRSIASSAKFGLEHVIYETDEQVEFCNLMVETWLEIARAEINRPLPPTLLREQLRSYLFAFFSGCATGFLPRIKSHHFRSECEWRLGHLHGRAECDCQVRVREPGDIPYIEIQLNDTSGLMPISSVWLGPGIANEDSVRKVTNFLVDLGYTSTEVHESEIPLRIEQGEFEL